MEIWDRKTSVNLGRWSTLEVLLYQARTSPTPTSPIPSHCDVITWFKSVPVQLSQLALYKLKHWREKLSHKTLKFLQLVTTDDILNY